MSRQDKIVIRHSKSSKGRPWFEGECPQCDYVCPTEVTRADAIHRTEAHIKWWHEQQSVTDAFGIEVDPEIGAVASWLPWGQPDTSGGFRFGSRMIG